MQRYRRVAGAGHQQRNVEGGVREQYWPSTLMALGVITVLAVVLFVGSRTFIGYGTLFRWFALFAFVGNLLPYARSGLMWGMERLEWFLFNLLAVGPFVLSIALLLNFVFHGEEKYYVVHGSVANDRIPAYWAANGELPPNTPLDGSDGREPDAVLWRAAPSDRLLGIANGCLGYPVMTVWERVLSEE